MVKRGLQFRFRQMVKLRLKFAHAIMPPSSWLYNLHRRRRQPPAAPPDNEDGYLSDKKRQHDNPVYSEISSESSATSTAADGGEIPSPLSSPSPEKRAPAFLLDVQELNRKLTALISYDDELLISNRRSPAGCVGDIAGRKLASVGDVAGAGAMPIIRTPSKIPLDADGDPSSSSPESLATEKKMRRASSPSESSAKSACDTTCDQHHRDRHNYDRKLRDYGKITKNGEIQLGSSDRRHRGTLSVKPSICNRSRVGKDPPAMVGRGPSVKPMIRNGPNVKPSLGYCDIKQWNSRMRNAAGSVKQQPILRMHSKQTALGMHGVKQPIPGMHSASVKQSAFRIGNPFIVDHPRKSYSHAFQDQDVVKQVHHKQTRSMVDLHPGHGFHNTDIDAAKIIELVMHESSALVKTSLDPHIDFKESMQEMIFSNNLHRIVDLVELLQCYLALNSDHYHHTIVMAFYEVWREISCYQL